MRRLFGWLIPALGFAAILVLVGAAMPDTVLAIQDSPVATGGILTGMLGLAMGAVVDLKTLYIDENKKVYRPGRNVEMPDADAEKLGLKPKTDAEVKESTEINNPTGLPSGETGTGGGGGDEEIPDDFPGAEELRAAGFTMADVREATKEDLVEIEGIGDKTADKIIAAR